MLTPASYALYGMTPEQRDVYLSQYDMMSPGITHYDPLRVSAYTGGNMPGLPPAQYLTPASYGLFRTPPAYDHTIIPTAQQGFMRNLMIATNGFGTGFLPYNPAVNPVTYEVDSRRQLLDKSVAFGTSMAGLPLDMAQSAAWGLAGKGLAKAFGLGAIATPIGLAAGIAMPMLGATFSLGDAIADRIRETRAIQYATRSKITSGPDLDQATGMGFSTRAARDIDRFIRKSAIHDFLFKEDDYRSMLNVGMQEGMFDFANTAEQYKDKLKQLRKVTSQVMDVIGSSDFKDIVKHLKRLQDVGITNMASQVSTIRREGVLARAAGISHAQLVEQYVKPGMMMYQQLGLDPLRGGEAMAANAAMFETMRRQGLISPAQLARMGGMSGAVQAVTETTARTQRTLMDYMIPYVSNQSATGIDMNRFDELYNGLMSGKMGHGDLVRGGTSRMANDPKFNLLQRMNHADLTTKLADAVPQTKLDQMTLLIAHKMGEEMAKGMGIQLDRYQQTQLGLQKMGYTEDQARLFHSRVVNAPMEEAMRAQERREARLKELNEEHRQKTYNEGLGGVIPILKGLGNTITEAFMGIGGLHDKYVGLSDKLGLTVGRQDDGRLPASAYNAYFGGGDRGALGLANFAGVELKRRNLGSALLAAERWMEANGIKYQITGGHKAVGKDALEEYYQGKYDKLPTVFTRKDGSKYKAIDCSAFASAVGMHVAHAMDIDMESATQLFFKKQGNQFVPRTSMEILDAVSAGGAELLDMSKEENWVREGVVVGFDGDIARGIGGDIGNIDHVGYWTMENGKPVFIHRGARTTRMSKERFFKYYSQYHFELSADKAKEHKFSGDIVKYNAGKLGTLTFRKNDKGGYVSDAVNLLASGGIFAADLARWNNIYRSQNPVKSQEQREQIRKNQEAAFKQAIGMLEPRGNVGIVDIAKQFAINLPLKKLGDGEVILDMIGTKEAKSPKEYLAQQGYGYLYDIIDSMTAGKALFDYNQIRKEGPDKVRDSMKKRLKALNVDVDKLDEFLSKNTDYEKLTLSALKKAMGEKKLVLPKGVSLDDVQKYAFAALSGDDSFQASMKRQFDKFYSSTPATNASAAMLERLGIKTDSQEAKEFTEFFHSVTREHAPNVRGFGILPFIISTIKNKNGSISEKDYNSIVEYLGLSGRGIDTKKLASETNLTKILDTLGLSDLYKQKQINIDRIAGMLDTGSRASVNNGLQVAQAMEASSAAEKYRLLAPFMYVQWLSGKSLTQDVLKTEASQREYLEEGLNKVAGLSLADTQITGMILNPEQLRNFGLIDQVGDSPNSTSPVDKPGEKSAPFSGDLTAISDMARRASTPGLGIWVNINNAGGNSGGIDLK